MNTVSGAKRSSSGSSNGSNRKKVALPSPALLAEEFAKNRSPYEQHPFWKVGR